MGNARAIVEKTKRNKYKWQIIDDHERCLGYSTRSYDTAQDARNNAVMVFLILSKGIDGKLPWYLRLGFWLYRR